MALSILTKDAIYSILKQTEPRDVINFYAVNTWTRKMCNKPGLFQALLRDHFPKHNIPTTNYKRQYFALTEQIVSVYKAKIHFVEGMWNLYFISTISIPHDKYIGIYIDGIVEHELQGYAGIRLNQSLSLPRNSLVGLATFHYCSEDALIALYSEYVRDVQTELETNVEIPEDRDVILGEMVLDPKHWCSEDDFRLRTSKHPLGECGSYHSLTWGVWFNYYLHKVVLPPNSGVKLR
jgi:hypothetical protein